MRSPAKRSRARSREKRAESESRSRRAVCGRSDTARSNVEDCEMHG